MEWVSPHDGFESASFCNDELFNRLWSDGRLRVHGHSSGTDWIDEVNARLVSSALAHGENLFIGLPDSRRHRAALLLATCVLRFWYSRRSQRFATPGVVAYCGSTVGIREQLGHVSVPHLCLSDVFRQNDVGRRGASLRSQVGATGGASLPEGVQRLAWDGRGDTGTSVPGGRYLVTIEARTEDGHVARALAPLSVGR